jgi:hypothetical protein
MSRPPVGAISVRTRGDAVHNRRHRRRTAAGRSAFQAVDLQDILD